MIPPEENILPPRLWLIVVYEADQGDDQPLTIRLSRPGSLAGTTLTFSLNILGGGEEIPVCWGRGRGICKIPKILKVRICRHYTTFNENFRTCGILRG